MNSVILAIVSITCGAVIGLTFSGKEERATLHRIEVLADSAAKLKQPIELTCGEQHMKPAPKTSSIPTVGIVTASR